MPERDWSKELAKVDRQLEGLSDEALLPSKDARTPAARAEAKAVQASTSTWGVLLRLVLSIALGVGVMFWPYEARCGAGLAGYLGAVAVVAVGGVWSAVWSWRHRAARAHVLSLLLALWGLTLVAVEVLPRTGYARTTAVWACH